jgi:glycosyltransferase involved in cell wall biosynthesis
MAARWAGTLRRADRILARDDIQRDWLLGALAGLGRLTPELYDLDHSLDCLAAVPDDPAAALRAWCAAPARAPGPLTGPAAALPRLRAEPKGARPDGVGRVVILLDDAVGEAMAGPAVRAWEMATALAKVCQVRLVSTVSARLGQGPGFTVHQASGARLRAHVDWSDTVVCQGYVLDDEPWIGETDRYIVADLYDPFHLEQFEQSRDRAPEERTAAVRRATNALNRQIRRADALLCASAKQRAFWSGQIAMMGRQERSATRWAGLDDLLSVVPFGVPDAVPRATAHGLRGVEPGIGADDKVVIWAGGVYNWFDPLTLVRAVASLAGRHTDLRLFFMGLKHPNPAVGAMDRARQLTELSDELGLTGRHVFFNRGWTPYSERANWLLDADVGVSTHHEHLETAYSFRTRILDYLWAGLPIVASRGDSFGDVIDAEGIGVSVPPEDVDALAAALERLLYDPAAAAAARANVARFAERFRWSAVLEPITAFCRHPRRAADLVDRDLGEALATRLVSHPGRDLGLAWSYLKTGGPRFLLARVKGRLRRQGREPR